MVYHERRLAKESLLLWENEGCLALRSYEKLRYQSPLEARRSFLPPALLAA